MIKKTTFIKLINIITQRIEEADKIDKALKIYDPTFNSFEDIIIDRLIKLLEEDLDTDLISWYIFEDVDKILYNQDGTTIDVSTPEKLYDFIKEEYEPKK